MNYEKICEDAMETALYFVECGYITMEQAIEMFPQLAESKDEKIRKELIEFIQWSEDRGFTRHDFHQAKRPLEWIAWLEKQKEEEGYEAIPVESTLEYKLGFKAGKESEKQKEQKELPLMNGNADLYFDEWNQQKQNPTKRQCFEEGMRYAEKLQKEQKSVEWSEEDEKMWNWVIRYFEQDEELHKESINWLKSLRPQPKQEWSKKDKKILQSLHHVMNCADAQNAVKRDGLSVEDVCTFLFSIQPSWKPSKEDIKMLEHIIGQYETGNKNSRVMGYLPRVEELNFLKKVLVKWKN